MACWSAAKQQRGRERHALSAARFGNGWEDAQGSQTGWPRPIAAAPLPAAGRAAALRLSREWTHWSATGSRGGRAGGLVKQLVKQLGCKARPACNQAVRTPHCAAADQPPPRCAVLLQHPAPSTHPQRLPQLQRRLGALHDGAPLPAGRAVLLRRPCPTFAVRNLQRWQWRKAG